MFHSFSTVYPGISTAWYLISLKTSNDQAYIHTMRGKSIIPQGTWICSYYTQSSSQLFAFPRDTFKPLLRYHLRPHLSPLLALHRQPQQVNSTRPPQTPSHTSLTCPQSSHLQKPPSQQPYPKPYPFSNPNQPPIQEYTS